MIQRIQSLYLLLAFAAMTVTLCLPIAVFATGGTELVLSAFALAPSDGGAPGSALWMGILLVLSTLLPFAVIFMYRHRMLQIRLCGVELVLLLGDLVFIAIYCWLALRASGGEWSSIAASLRVPAVLPLVAAVLVAMAMRSIFRDEILVRSLDRIR